MAIVPLYGHHALRARLSEALAAKKLPASLLFTGPRGVGKQRLAIWLGQAILCTGDSPPCGNCQSCRYFRELTHPDFHWIFPRAKLKDSDPDIEQIRSDYAEAVAERAADGGLYSPPSGMEGIYLAAVRMLVRDAAFAPAIGRAKVFVVGDAERMVPQESSQEAANAFLKLLEEPPADSTIILTSSEPGALLPTVQSRVITVRVPLLADADLKAFVDDESAKATLDARAKASSAERVRAAGGAPGRLLSEESTVKATVAARKLLDAALSASPSSHYAASLSQGAAGARGAFSETLDALLGLLGERMREALHRHDERDAGNTSRAMDAALQAKKHLPQNVSPQLLASRLLADLSATLR